MRITLLIILIILGSNLFAQELFYSEDGLQSSGYSRVDTILTLSKNIRFDKAPYVLKRVNIENPYFVSGADTISLPQALFSYKADSIEYFILYNSGSKQIKLLRQDGSLITTKEAVNYQNKWKPVEFWIYSWCGNSYYPMILDPGQLMLFTTYKLKGGSNTTMRLRLKTESNAVLISESFESSVDPYYFELNTEFRKYMFVSKDRFTYLK